MWRKQVKITLESTNRIITVNGTKARIWEGESAAGVPIVAAIATIAVHNSENQAEFERELDEQHKTVSERGIQAFPLRFFLD